MDQVDWPNDLADARRFFDALPATAHGETKRGGAATGGLEARYGAEEAAGSSQVFARLTAESGAESGLPSDPPSALATFASYLACDPATRAGTAPVAGLATATEDNDVWFSCRISDSVDREMHPGGRALGWTSGGVLWFVLAPDAATVRQLVSAMVEVATGLPRDGPGTPTAATTAEAPYGLEDAAWPETMDEAAALASRLQLPGGHVPDVILGGEPYNPSADVLAVSAGTQGMDANAELSFMFGMDYGCATSTLKGDATGIEGLDPGRPPSGTKVRWFTCRVEGAQADESFRGYAVGWTSGKLAWLVIASSEQRAGDLLGALVSASRL